MRASRPAAALLLAAGLGLLLGPLQPAAAASKNWTLLWGDEFEGNELDRTQWNYELGWGCQYLSAGWPMCGFGNKELVSAGRGWAASLLQFGRRGSSMQAVHIVNEEIVGRCALHTCSKLFHTLPLHHAPHPTPPPHTLPPACGSNTTPSTTPRCTMAACTLSHGWSATTRPSHLPGSSPTLRSCPTSGTGPSGCLAE